jgi:DNA-binding NtrC family response regulator
MPRSPHPALSPAYTPEDSSDPALHSEPRVREMVGNGVAMTRLRLQVHRIGPHFRTVLVSGETGTGKELVARELHRVSQGAGGPFVVCSASAPGDAVASHPEDSPPGDSLVYLARMAHRGTLFFDGIDEMPLQAQARLLRVLRRHEWAQEELTELRRMDLRIIASTSEDLRVLVAAGRFRQELYQRIAMVEMSMPALRERIEDIPQMAMHFLRRFAVLYGRDIDQISDDAIKRLQQHRWPGNIRELENAIRNGVLQSDGAKLEAHHLPPLMEPHRNPHANWDSDMTLTPRLQDVVEQHVLRVLRSCAGNKLRTAELLGISRSTLYRMLDACTPSYDEVEVTR